MAAPGFEPSLSERDSAVATKRREIELLKAELAARETTDSAGEAACAAKAAAAVKRRAAEMVTDEDSFLEDEAAALEHEEAEARAALARLHGSGGGARLSSRPTDTPVTRFEVGETPSRETSKDVDTPMIESARFLLSNHSKRFPCERVMDTPVR